MKILTILAALATAAAAQPNMGTPQEVLGVKAFSTQELAIPVTGWKPFSLTVRLGETDRVIDFVPRSIRGSDFRVLVQDEFGKLQQVEAPPEATYRGTIADEPGAVIAGTMVDGKLTAMVRLGMDPGQTWSIQPLSVIIPGVPGTSHIITRDSDAVPGPWQCGVTERARPFIARPGSAGPDAPQACQIACDADYEFFLANGSNVQNTTNDISSVINGVSAIYLADANVAMVLGPVIVRQSATQPYTSTNAGTLLDQFRIEWNASQSGTVRDVAHLFTGKDIDGSTIGLAYVGVVCNSTFGYGFSQSRYTLNFNNRVGVTSHEVGHNFNLDHCDANCSPCRIMCSGIGGCTGVVTSFGCSAAALFSYAQGRACLSQLNNGLTPPFVDTFAATTLDYTRWPNPTNSGGVVNTNAVGERSAPYSLNLVQASSITMAGVDLSGFAGRRVYVMFWTQHRDVEAGETLAVSYRRTVQGDYLPLTTVTSSGTNQNTFTFHQITLPTDGQGANASIRFTAQGNDANDNWYIDDVIVSSYCRADLNQDYRLNILDFQVYQAGLNTQSVAVCDWNGDGFITFADYTGFVNAVAAGCTGY